MIEPVVFAVPATFDQPTFPGRACQGYTTYAKDKAEFEQPLEVAYAVRKPSICSNEACETVVCTVVLEGKGRYYSEHCHVEKGLPVRITLKPGAPNKVIFTIGTRVTEEVTEEVVPGEEMMSSESKIKRLLARFRRNKV